MNTYSEFEKRERKGLSEGFRVGAQARILFSIASTFVWLGFSLYEIAFLWRNFNFLQNIALLAVAFMIFSASNAILWVLE